MPALALFILLMISMLSYVYPKALLWIFGAGLIGMVLAWVFTSFQIVIQVLPK